MTDATSCDIRFFLCAAASFRAWALVNLEFDNCHIMTLMPGS